MFSKAVSLKCKFSYCFSSTSPLTCTLFQDTFETLTPFHKALQNEALSFASTHIKPFSYDWEKNGVFPKDFFKSAGKLGYGGVFGSETHGGRNSGRLGASVIFEALAEYDVGISAYTSIQNMLGDLLEGYGSQELKERYLRPCFTFEKLNCYCLTEPEAGCDPSSLKTTAVEDGDHYLVNGTKSLVIGAGETQVFMVFCRTAPQEISALLIDSDTEGIVYGKKPHTLGMKAIPIRDVSFTDCRVPKRNLLGKKGDGLKYALTAIGRERLNIASCAVGGATFCLKLAINHFKEDNGKKNRINQEFEFKIADIASKLLSCKLLLRRAATGLDKKEPKTVEMTAQTKWYVPVTAFEIINECMKIFGENGIFSKNKIEKVLRDVRALQFAGGTVEIMKYALQRELLK